MKPGNGNGLNGEQPEYEVFTVSDSSDEENVMDSAAGAQAVTDSESEDEENDGLSGGDISDLECNNDDDNQDNPSDITEYMQKAFCAFPATDEDLGGIEALCKQVLKHLNIDLNELARVLVGQNYVTTVLKADEIDDYDMEIHQEEDTDNAVYGVYSAINLKTKKDNPAVKKLIDVLLEKSQVVVDKQTRKLLEELLIDSPYSDLYSPAFLIKEKMVNIPGIASAPCMLQLKNDLEAAVLKNMPFKFTHYIHIAKMINLKNDIEDEYFPDQDDELINKSHSGFFNIHYDSSVDTNVKFQNDKGKTIEGNTYRRVYILSNEDMENFFKEMDGCPGVSDLVNEAKSSGLK